MKVRSLTLERIFESDFSFDFSTQNNNLLSVDSEKLINGITLALYGDETLTAGKSIFSFALNEDNYTVVRDFDANKSEISKNGVRLNGNTYELILDIIKIEKSAFCDMFIVVERDFENFCASPQSYLEKALAFYGISDNIPQIDFYKDEIQKIKANIAYLNSLKTSGDAKTLNAEIAKIENDLIEVNNKLSLAQTVADNKKEIESLNARLLESKENASKLLSYKEELKNNEKKEKLISIANKNIEVGQENKTLLAKLDSLNTRLALLKKDNVSGTGDNSEPSEYDNVVSEIEKTLNELNAAKLPYTAKKAFREALVLETSLAGKKDFLEKLNTEIEQANARITTLKEQINNNELLLLEEKAKTVDKLGRDITYEQLYDELNENEKQKQALYRNQIIIANTEREISAVDNKIYENEEAQRSYIEDRNVLENAKNTLLGYIKKVNDKFSVIEEKLIALTAQKKYHDSIALSSYGDKCPVCKGVILEKSDFSKESILIQKAYDDLIKDKQKANAIKLDYDSQLDKINIRLGELLCKINTSLNYLKSLKETKQAKLELIKKLLELSKVRSLSHLTEALDGAIKKVAITTNEFIEIKKFVLIEDTVKQSITDAENQIKKLEEEVLPKANSLKKQTKKDIDAFSKGLASLKQYLGEVTLEEKSEEITKIEENEDILNKKLDELNAKKAELYDKQLAREKEISAILIETQQISAKIAMNNEMLTILNESADFDPAKIETSEVKNEMLDENRRAEMVAFIEKNDNSEKLISIQIALLNKKLEQNKEYGDSYEENLNLKNSLLAKLYEKQGLVVTNDFIIKNIEKASAQLSEKEEKVKFFNSNEKLSILAEKTEAILNDISSNLFSIKLSGGNFTLLEKGKASEAAEGRTLALISVEKAISQLTCGIAPLSLQRIIITNADTLDQNIETQQVLHLK